MAFKPSMSVANFTCLFGNKKVLLDLFSEVVYKSFFDSPPRVIRNNEFYLFELEFLNAGSEKEPEPVISGLFVRNTDLKRSHILRETKLIEDSDKIESATSARFVLILSTHTLIYVTETPNAPPIAMFRSTMQHHLNKAWAEYIKTQARKKFKAALKTKNPSERPRVREIALGLMEDNPKPELEINPLPSELSVKAFLSQFESITTVEYKISDTNHSPDLTPLLAQLRNQKEATNSQKIVVIESKPRNKEAVADQLAQVTADGNVEAKVTGTTSTGGRVTGTNDEFNLSTPFEESLPPKNVKNFIRRALSKLNHLISSKQIVVHPAPKTTKDKILTITPAKTLD
jgi:hypothetical protein